MFRRILKNTTTIIVVIALVAGIVSCEKDVDTQLMSNSSVTTDLVNESLEKDSITTRSPKSAHNVFADVVTTDMHDINPGILAYFQYWCQNTGFNYTTNYCAPTCFMMSVACLLNYHNAYNKFNPSYNMLLNFASIPNYDNIASIGYITSNYSNIGAQLCTYPNTTQGRTNAKQDMEYYLDNNNFLVVALRANVSLTSQDFYSYYTPTNPDLVNNQTYTNSNYLQKTSSYTNHAVIVLRIDKFETGNGIVTYIDPFRPANSGSNRRYCLYSRLMDSMKFTDPNLSDSYFFTRIWYSN